MNYKEHLKTISLDGGALCLDFINTVSDYFIDEPVNYIQSEEEWITWLVRVKLLERDVQFKESSFDLRKILELREILYHIFINYITKKTISASGLKKFNKYLEWANRHINIKLDEDRIVESFQYDSLSANNYLIPIIKSAKDLLISDSVKYIKQCGNCGWIYLDKSKNRTRRWCNMKACGNKIKTQKYYRKSAGKKISSNSAHE